MLEYILKDGAKEVRLWQEQEGPSGKGEKQGF